MSRLVEELGSSARAATASETAAAGDFVVVAVPLKLVNDMPAAELAGKVVIDTNNYMPWRDGSYPMIDRGEKTEHELRQEQLPSSKVVKAFTHLSRTYRRPGSSHGEDSWALPIALRSLPRATFPKPSRS